MYEWDDEQLKIIWGAIDTELKKCKESYETNREEVFKLWELLTKEGEILELFDSIPFTFEKKDFEIRIYYNDVTINVVAFLNGYPANGYRYQVKIPKKCSAKKVLENSPILELVEKCKNDIKEKKWEKLLKIIQESKNN